MLPNKLLLIRLTFECNCVMQLCHLSAARGLIFNIKYFIILLQTNKIFYIIYDSFLEMSDKFIAVIIDTMSPIGCNYNTTMSPFGCNYNTTMSPIGCNYNTTLSPIGCNYNTILTLFCYTN
jgi:hypothetical protein